MNFDSEILPPVLDADIDEMERCLRVKFDATRREILRSNKSFDVQAAPGSGKTTLLVAKLAILAKKWPYSRRGICVLSHTNVAREEVEKKLAGTIAGQRLLEYPHFIGTIHGFVNEFLALPYLRSEKQVIRLIDDEASGNFCQSLLYHDPSYSTAKFFLKRRNNFEALIRGLRIEGDSVELKSAGGKLPCGPTSQSFKQLLTIKRRAAGAGYWRHDDMFAMAGKFISSHPKAAEIIRWRFPAVFIDETQDTSELQSSVVGRIFPLYECVLRQRFGDPNQAIYDFGDSQATSDPFPREVIRSLPNSKRFGPLVAKKAEPLAVRKPDPELIGDGPQAGVWSDFVDPANMPHTIFFFKKDSAQEVLPAFGKLLLATFPDSMIQSSAFLARAVGRVGKVTEGAEETRPRNLSDYWPGYEPSVTKREPRPKKLSDYLHLAQRKRGQTGDYADVTRTVARGLIELIDKITPVDVACKARGINWLRESLSSDKAMLARLQDLLWGYCVELTPVTERTWQEQVSTIRGVLHPLIDGRWTRDAEEFSIWSSEFAGHPTNESLSTPIPPNRYMYSDAGREVEIDVGTIHGSKGQTHTATLLFETFQKVRDLADLLPWLIEGKTKPGQGPERLDRMRLIFTAMTRPSHLLCLAMRSDALGIDEKKVANISALQAAGWQLIFL